jgi:hypothetical protein
MKNRRYISIIALLLTAIVLQSCDSTLTIDPPKTFYKYLGADGNQRGIDITIDDENSIYVLGSTESSSDKTQIYVVKTDGNGIVQWETTFGDAGDEIPKDIELLRGGTSLVVVADRTDNASGSEDFVMYMISALDGSLVQAPVIGGSTTNPDHINSITQTLDGGFIVATYREVVDPDLGTPYKAGYVYRYSSDFLLMPFQELVEQLKSSGDEENYDMVPVKVFQYDDDTYYQFGYTNTRHDTPATPDTPGVNDVIKDYNIYAIANNSGGDAVAWVVLNGPSDNSDERLTSALPAPASSGSGFVLSGYTSDPGSNEQELIILHTVEDLTSVTDQPAQALQRPLKIVSQGLSTVSGAPASVYPTRSPGFLVLGEQNINGEGNLYLTRLANNLDPVWTDPQTFRSIGGEGNDAAGTVMETSDGFILVCGTMTLGELNGQTKIVLIKLDPQGMFTD